MPRTRVEIEHLPLARHGPAWPALRDGIGGDQCWLLYLDGYAAPAGTLR